MRKSVVTQIIVVVFVLAAVMITGCASPTVKMKRETADWRQEQAMVQRSLERFDEGAFYVYVYEWREGLLQPWSLM